MRVRRLTVFLAVLVTVLFPDILRAQQGCPAPTFPPASRQPNIFSERQENDLGDAIAEHFHREFRLIEDPEVTGYLQRIGDRILKQLPPTSLRYRFHLSDLPTTNAFAGPGARIYVSRKLVAFTRSEDELAGVLAHEVGHVVARQGSITMTMLFQRILNVNQVGDRRDIFEKYHQFIENLRRRSVPSTSERQEEREQIAADQVAFQAAVRAGYAPEAFAAFLDRLLETEGKTGNWFTNLFGATKPEQRRLRELLKAIPKVPEACIERRAGETDEFQKWQAAVIAYSGVGHPESLPGVVARRQLSPPLRTDIEHLLFSPDGKYALAQDDSSIFVLHREPFGMKFRIDAEDALPARFTPDSQSVVFYTPGLRVETWDIAGEQRSAVHEVYKKGGCLQTALSPDGKFLACYEPEYHLTLLDVESGAEVLQKKGFYEPYGLELFVIWIQRLLAPEGQLEILKMGYSPDARYFVAARNGTGIGVNLTNRTVLPLSGKMKDLLSGGFAFLGTDRVAAVAGQKGEKSVLVRFPSGEEIQKLPLGRQRIVAASAGEFLLLRPIDKYPVGALDLKRMKMDLASKRNAFDIHNDVHISERTNGEIAIYRNADAAIVSKTFLPQSPMGRLQAAALSPDTKWLAVSERTRGAMWNVTTGERVFLVRGFRGAGFSATGGLYADFPEYQETKRSLAVLDPSNRRVVIAQELGESSVRQYGPFLLTRVAARKGGSVTRDITLEVRDVSPGTLLWSKGFPHEVPAVYVSESGGAFAFLWSTVSDTVKAVVKEDPQLKANLAELKEKEGDYYLLVVDAVTGATQGRLFIETGKGSFRISNVLVAGDFVAIEDTSNRVLLYSLSAGKLLGRLFGHRAALSQTANTLCVENEPGTLGLYDLASVEKRGELRFVSPVSFTQFSQDGKRLFVLTKNQNAFLVDLAEAVRRSELAEK